MATNEIFSNLRGLSVACSDPSSPTSGDLVRYGQMVGVAVTDESAGGNASGNTTVDFGPAVYDVSVKGENNAGNSAVAVGEPLYYTDGETYLSKKETGYFAGVALEAVNSGSTDTIRVAFPGANPVGAANLPTNLKTGFIPLDITALRIISGNAIGNLSEGMLLDGNTAPSLARVNGATDKALRVIWAATSEVEVQFPPIPKPPDMDDAQALTVHLMLAKDTNTDTAAVVAVSIWDGVGDTNAGGTTSALSSATLGEKTVTLAAGDLAAAPSVLNISLTPGTHANDAIYLYGAWIEYQRA